MSATASFFRGVEVAQNIIHEYQTTGVIKEDGDFIGLSLGYAIVECFPKSSVQLIPLLANPADVDKLIAMMGQAITDHNAKNRAEAEKLTAKLADPGFYAREPGSVAGVKSRLEAIEQEITATFARWEELEAVRTASA